MHVERGGGFRSSAFGIDRGLPFPVADIARAEVILLVGANPAETMPPLMQYFERSARNGGQLIVVDPRRTLTAQSAQLHLRLIPGTDAALAGGLLHILIRDGLIDEAYIRERTEGFGEVEGSGRRPTGRIGSNASPASPKRVSSKPRRLLGNARSAMILTARGPEQQSQGVNNTLAFINLALALGLPGRPFSGFGTITGQGNGQGGREHGQKADQLPGYRRIDDPEARAARGARVGRGRERDSGAGQIGERVAAVAGRRRQGALHDRFQFRGLGAGRDRRDRARADDSTFFAASDFFLSETARMADVVLPAAMWAEEEGTMTNLEGRVIRRRRAQSAAAGREIRHRDYVRTGGAPGAGTLFQLRECRRDLQRTAPRVAGRRRRLLRRHVAKDRGESGRLLAVPGRRASRDAAALHEFFPDAERAGAISRRAPRGAG